MQSNAHFACLHDLLHTKRIMHHVPHKMCNMGRSRGMCWPVKYNWEPSINNVDPLKVIPVSMETHVVPQFFKQPGVVLPKEIVSQRE